MLLHNAKPDAGQTDAEDGYLLLTVLVMIFLVLLALSIAAPKLAKQIQRDKEQEAVERGLQYRRAIQLYYKKFSAYPTDIKQLEKTNEIRFLRKRYKDPITGKDDWRLIHVGEAKVPPLGFFGQPLQTGLSSTSTGPGLAGSIYAPTDTDGSGGTNGSSGSSTGSSTGLSNGSSSGSNNGSGSSSGFGFSNSGSSSGSSGGFGSSGSSFGSSNGGMGSSGGFGSSGSGGGIGTPTGTLGTNVNSNGSTFGSAGPIVGVGIPVKKDSLLEYHKQKKYSDWEFVYDPQTDLMMNAGAITNGGNVNGTNSNNPAGTGASGSNGSGFGNSGSSGSSGSGFGNFGSSGSSGSSGSGFGNFGSSGSGSGSNGGSGSATPNSPQQ